MLDSAGRKRNAMYCVIVGDIINSKEIVGQERREAVSRAVKGVFSSINARYRDSLLADFGVVRGDGFEGVLLEKHLAPKIIQELIKGFYLADKTCVRVAAVVGELSLVSSDRNECDGPAFHRALELLETLKANKRSCWQRIAFFAGGSAQPIIDSQLLLLGALMDGWTERQREIVWAAEECGSNTLAAKKLGIKPSVVSKQLKAANYAEYRMAWDSLRQYLLFIDEAEKAAEKQSNYPAYYSLALSEYEHGNSDRAAELLRMAQKK